MVNIGNIKEYREEIVCAKIPLRQKPVKVKKVKKTKAKHGRPKKGEVQEPVKITVLQQQQQMDSVQEMLRLASTDCGTGVK